MLAHRLLGGGSSSLSVSCPSLGSALRVRLMPVSGAPLSHALHPLSSRTRKQRGKKESLASSAAPAFHGLPPGQLWCTNPFRLCSRHQPQSSPCDLIEDQASAPSPHPSRRVSRQASRAGECWSASILCAGISPLCPLHPCCCALLGGFCCCGAWALGVRASVVVARGLSSCGSWALELRLSSCGTWA